MTRRDGAGSETPSTRPSGPGPRDSSDEAPIDGEERTVLGEIRMDGDVIEIPLVEEVLVKKRVVREVVRIRKDEIVERRIVRADLRTEDVEVTPTKPRETSGHSDDPPRI